MSTLVQNYKAALASLRVVEEPEAGPLFYQYQDGEGKLVSHPIVIDDKPLVLPYKANLNAERLEEVVAFHPLSESVIRGESEVLQKLRQLMGVRFKTVVSELAAWMAMQAVDPKAAKRFSPKQKAFFDILADATQNTVTALTKLIEAGYSSDPEHVMLRIYMRRTGATYQGQKVTRASIVSFPFMEAKDVKNKKQVWCGVEMSQKDMRMLTALFQYLVPQIDEPGEAYNAGSNDTQAPYFDSLIHSFAKLMENLNNIILLLGDKYPAGKEMFTDLSWVAEFEPLSQYRGQIPSLPYNDGALLNKTPEPAAQQATKVVNNNVSGVTQQQPAAPAQAAPATNQSPLDKILNKAKEQEQPTNRWAAPATSQQQASGGNDPYTRLMEGIYNKSGIPIPAGGFGAAPTPSWGGGQAPQSPSALRRRAANRAAEIQSSWTGIKSGGW